MEWSPETAVVGGATLALILLWNRLVPRVPGYIVALLAGTVAVALAQLPVETIGSRFGGLPSGLPAFRVPQFRPDLALTLLSPTLTVAMLGAIESLISAVVADRIIGGRHNSNVESSRRESPTSSRRLLAGSRPPVRSRGPPRTSDRAAGRRWPG